MGIRNALRQATHPQHHALEEHPLLATLQTPDVVMDDVICIEQAFAAYHSTAAWRLTRWQQELDYTPFPHADVLIHDLQCLGSAPAPALRPDVPEFTSLAEAAGYLYVAEGSLLGNRLIARHLTTALPEYYRRGCRYYDPDTARITAHWPSLCALLERLSDQPAARDRMTASARRTFDGIGDCLAAAATAWPDSRQLKAPLS
jgi:heme oxygenase